MGLGNLTELIDADSVGINAVMAGVIAELDIDYVLTTEVISWARGAVRELDLARKLMHYAVRNRVLPKGLDDGLVALKDTPFETYSEAELRDMQRRVRDKNYRIFTNREWIFVFNRGTFLRGKTLTSSLRPWTLRTLAMPSILAANSSGRRWRCASARSTRRSHRCAGGI